MRRTHPGPWLWISVLSHSVTAASDDGPMTFRAQSRHREGSSETFLVTSATASLRGTAAWGPESVSEPDLGLETDVPAAPLPQSTLLPSDAQMAPRPGWTDSTRLLPGGSAVRVRDLPCSEGQHFTADRDTFSPTLYSNHCMGLRMDTFQPHRSRPRTGGQP